MSTLSIASKLHQLLVARLELSCHREPFRPQYRPRADIDLICTAAMPAYTHSLDDEHYVKMPMSNRTGEIEISWLRGCFELDLEDDSRALCSRVDLFIMSLKQELERELVTDILVLWLFVFAQRAHVFVAYSPLPGSAKPLDGTLEPPSSSSDLEDFFVSCVSSSISSTRCVTPLSCYNSRSTTPLFHMEGCDDDSVETFTAEVFQ